MQENINFKLNRILAALVDSLIIFIIISLTSVFSLAEFIIEVNKDAITIETTIFLVLSVIAGFLLAIVYLFVTFVIFKNATLGMKMMHLTYIKYDGTIPSKLTFLGHSSLAVLSFIFSLGLTTLANLVAVLNNENGRNFHDVCSGLKMVNQYDL